MTLGTLNCTRTAQFASYQQQNMHLAVHMESADLVLINAIHLNGGGAFLLTLCIFGIVGSNSYVFSLQNIHLLNEYAYVSHHGWLVWHGMFMHVT